MIEARRGGSPAAFGLVPLFGTILLLWLLLWGCGIPSAGFIGPPGETDGQDLESLPVVTFDHNVEANDTEDFKGYELYYRFYDNNATDGTDYEVDREQILGSPPGTGVLESTGYRRVVRASGDSVESQELPLIPVPQSAKSQDFEVTLSFGLVSAVDPDEASARWLGNEEPLARSVPQEDSQAPKGFILGSYNGAEDEDLEQISRVIDQVIFEQQLYIALYGLGYGIDGLAFERIYSAPEFLGYFVLQPDQ
jgi:hypothetical protein